MITLASTNVNGVRAAARRGMLGWLAARRPDVWCLQEVRATDDDLRAAAGPGWHGVHEEGGAKGRAGVAVLSRSAPRSVRTGVGPAEFAGSGRWVEADLPLDVVQSGAGTLTVVSCYVPTGQAGTARQDEKHRFLDAIAARLGELSADGRYVVLTGDLNVAHREADLRNWRGNRAKAGFLPGERAWFDALLHERRWVDVLREHAGDVAGPYTWWSWRGRAFDDDSGWRIDYQIASAGLAARALTAQVDRAPTYAERWSDHAPVVVEYDVRLALGG